MLKRQCPECQQIMGLEESCKDCRPIAFSMITVCNICEKPLSLLEFEIDRDPYGICGECRRCRSDTFLKKEERRIAQKEKKREYEQLELETQQVREVEMARYRQLRKEIEVMPQYEHWRQAVLEKFSRKCAVCGSVDALEVDHRYKSFYAIVRDYGITNTIQAYECAALWDVNNGAPLCKICHDKTKSSVYHRGNSYR